MKRIIIKSILLIAAIALSVYGVLHWKHTVVAPPQQLEFDNCHNKNLAHSISRVHIDSLEAGYFECQYKLKRYQKEGLIDQFQANTYLEDLLNTYIPKFVKKSSMVFSNSKWDRKPWDHSFMKNRIEELKQLKRHDGSAVIETSSDYIVQMDSILTVIEMYDEAWILSSRTRFESVSTTKNRVNKAEAYRENMILKNCSDLVEALEELPFKIRDSHLGYLESLCDNFERYYLDKDYNTLDKELRDIYLRKIKAYDDYYKTTDDTKAMKEKLLDKQYEYLKMHTDYVLDVSHFEAWDVYKQMNEVVYHYLTEAVGNDKRIEELKNVYVARFKKNEQEFNAERFPQSSQK